MKKTTEAIERVVKDFAKMTKEDAQRYAPKHIAPYIVSSVGGKRSSGYIIKLSVTPISTDTTDGTEDARAQEYGSGMRATKGEKSYIKIIAKDKQALAFITSNPLVVSYSKQKKGTRKVEPLAQSVRTRKKWKRGVMDGNIVLVKKPDYVLHPGIYPYKGRGYLNIAVKGALEVIKAYAPPKIAKAVIFDVRDILTKVGGKRKK